MAQKGSDPWYLHLILYVVIAALTVILVKVAILDPKEIVAERKYYQTETRLRMKNLREAQRLYERVNEHFTDNLDTLIHFIKTSEFVDSIRTGYDSIAKRPTDTFLKLSHGEFVPESLYYTPRSHQKFVMQVDTLTNIDSVVNQFGKLRRIDTTIIIGENYVIEDPDGHGTIGDLYNAALKHAASWE